MSVGGNAAHSIYIIKRMIAAIYRIGYFLCIFLVNNPFKYNIYFIKSQYIDIFYLFLLVEFGWRRKVICRKSFHPPCCYVNSYGKSGKCKILSGFGIFCYLCDIRKGLQLFVPSAKLREPLRGLFYLGIKVASPGLLRPQGRGSPGAQVSFQISVP